MFAEAVTAIVNKLETDLTAANVRLLVGPETDMSGNKVVALETWEPEKDSEGSTRSRWTLMIGVRISVRDPEQNKTLTNNLAIQTVALDLMESIPGMLADEPLVRRHNIVWDQMLPLAADSGVEAVILATLQVTI